SALTRAHSAADTAATRALDEIGACRNIAGRGATARRAHIADRTREIAARDEAVIDTPDGTAQHNPKDDPEHETIVLPCRAPLQRMWRQSSDTYPYIDERRRRGPVRSCDYGFVMDRRCGAARRAARCTSRRPGRNWRS